MPNLEQFTSGGTASVVCIIAYIAVSALAKRCQNRTVRPVYNEFSDRLDRLENDLRDGLKGVHSRLDALWQHLSAKK